MAMLAEQKSRASWVLNPRASDWSKDQNKLGQKMLEKMGWSAGKGLGAKEQGPVEALRVAHKVDVRGLGASRKKEQEYWLQQQESFQSLLQNLNGGDEQNIEVKSLEERSKTSKARVHYHKFTRGKDISRYSKKDLNCIVGSGVAAPKVIPTSVVSNSQQQSADDLQSSIGDDFIENRDCASASTLDSKQHSTTEMRLRSERKRASGETVHAIENTIPAKKKKSKKDKNANDDVLKIKPSNSTVIDDLSPSKSRKSSRKLVSDHEISIIKESQKRPKRKSAISSNEDENPSVEQLTPVDDEEVLGSSKKSRNRKKSKKDALQDVDDNSIVAVKQGKNKNKSGNPLRDSVAEEKVTETEPKKKGRKKKKELIKNVEIQGSAVESQSSKRKSKRKMVSEPRDNGQDEIQTSLVDLGKTGKEKKKKKKDKSSEKLVDPEDLLVSESQETVVSSNVLHENEDAETELGSINSQSSLISELLGVKIHSNYSIDLSSRPESWFKNHILSPDSEDEISSNEESMTGIPKKKKM